MRAMYSAFISAMHHIFFPPRLQFMVLQQDTDGFLAHRWSQNPFRRFLGDQPYAPPRPAFRRRAANHGYDPFDVSALRSVPVLCLDAAFRTKLNLTPVHALPLRSFLYRLRRYACVLGHLFNPLPTVELAQNGSPPQNSRRLLSLAQHLGNLPPILPPQLNMHTVIALHQRPSYDNRSRFPEKYPRYIFILSKT